MSSELHVAEAPKKRPNACFRCRKRKVRCNGQLPACSNCAKAGTACERTANSQGELLERISFLENLVAAQDTQPTPLQSYESLSSPLRGHSSTPNVRRNIVDEPASFPTPDSSSIAPRSQQHGTNTLPQEEVAVASPVTSKPVAHEVGMLSLANASEPKYLGPSSGFTFASILYAAASQTQGLSATASELYPDVPSQKHLPRALPSSKELRKLIEAYFTVFHPLYPFLHESSFLVTAEAVRRLLIDTQAQTDLPPDQRNHSTIYSRSSNQKHDIAQLNLVLFLGARFSESKLKQSFDAEDYLTTAMKYLDTMALHDSLKGLQTLLLLLLCSLYSPNGLNAWFLRSTLIAGCVDLGVQRKVDSRKPYTLDFMKHHNIRSGVFWSAYSLDRTLSVVLGRPLTLRDEAFDIGFPDDPDAEEIENDASRIFESREQNINEQQPTRKRPRHSFTTTTPAGFSFRFDRIVAEVKLMLYRVSQSPARFPWPSEYSSWQEQVHDSCSRLWEEMHVELDRLDVLSGRHVDALLDNVMPFLELKYHDTLMLLYRPCPAIPRPTALALRFCLESAMETLRIYSDLHRAGGLTGSWLDAHKTFISAITVCYCLWVSPQLRKATSANLFANTAEMARDLLQSLGETWSVAKSACEKFEALAEWIKSSFEIHTTPEDADEDALDSRLMLVRSEDQTWPEIPLFSIDDSDIDWSAMFIDYENAAKVLPNEFQEIPDWFALEGWLTEGGLPTV